MQKRQTTRLLAAAASFGLISLVGCQSNPPGVPPEQGGHAIGWQDTPEATKAPPGNTPPGTPMGEDGTTSYADPSNPLPPGGLNPGPAPAAQPDAVRPNQTSR